MSQLSVSEAVAETGLSAHTLRYYEKEMLLYEVPRDSGGRRYYTLELIGALKFISALRATGMSIHGIKDYIDLYRRGEGTALQRMALLQTHEERVQEQLKETRASLSMIRKKIALYQTQLDATPSLGKRA
jgi:DNA-binding transcriptional MerR regulator